MDGKIPLLRASEVAEFDGETIAEITPFLLLTFPPGNSDLPRNSLVTVAVREAAVSGDAVALATFSGRTMTGFFQLCGEEAVVVSLHRRERLRWRTAESRNLIRWMFPILRVEMCGCTADVLQRHCTKKA